MHDCMLDRRISKLPTLEEQRSANRRNLSDNMDPALTVSTELFSIYLERLSKVVNNDMNCASTLSWLSIDNEGRRMHSKYQEDCNEPSIANALVIEAYQKLAVDEITIDVDDMIAITEMTDDIVDENGIIWWKGKHTSRLEVGLFPAHCVQIMEEDVENIEVSDNEISYNEVSDSMVSGNDVVENSCRFPKIEDCDHFCYERMNLGPVQLTLTSDKTEASDQFVIHVNSRVETDDKVCMYSYNFMKI